MIFSVTLCLIIFVGNVISHPQCTRDLQPGRLYSVADAEYDVCTKYPEDIKARAFSIQGISEKLVIDENEDKKFLLSPNGQTGAMELIVRDTENTLFAFKANIAFYGFQERCTTIRRELTDECYNSLSLPVDCYQCFSNWSATLIGFGNAAGITLDLVGKPTEPHVQIGVGANGKNINFGLSGLCEWKRDKCPPKSVCSGICSINVDLNNHYNHDGHDKYSSVKGDPHFVGFLGQKYDFHGVAGGVFNLITDISFHLNALFVEADLRPKKDKTYIGAVGVLIGSHKVHISCNRGAAQHLILLDGQHLERGLARTLTDENNASVQRDVTDKILIDSYPYKLRLWFSSSPHSSCHLTIKVSYAAGSPEYPHGVLGQTANQKITSYTYVKSLQGEGIIEGHWTDYRINGDDIFGTSFRYNKFDPTRARNEINESNPKDLLYAITM